MNDYYGIDDDPLKEFLSNPTFKAALERVDAFTAEQTASEKLSSMNSVLERMSDLLNTDSSCTRTIRRQLNALQERLYALPAPASAAACSNIESEMYSLLESEPKIRAAYDVVTELDAIDILSRRLKQLQRASTTYALPDAERAQIQSLEECIHTSRRVVEDGMQFLRE